MNINIEGAITINAERSIVFDYISNLENDKYWRKEINWTAMTAKPALGALAEESSFLSKRAPNNILKLHCIEFLGNKKVVYQTVPGSTFYLKSSRLVEAISASECKVIYSLSFDNGIIKHALGFSLPMFVSRMVAKNDMKKYLATLKSILETGNVSHISKEEQQVKA
ncbi:hypothetical protein [Aridibaculum aurantiacum]|uniref:hypothetical protein n=1 Tax=Aridibaculum aurantiacum TaxID=2810307 RepID=UPI001A959FD2|nr:hypothetical protein [Aridibaculum aurantiacum]